MRIRPNHAVLALLLAVSARLAPAQCVVSTTPMVAATPTEPMPAYEVATIKPVDASGFRPPLRVYIQQAFGISPNTTGWIVGPEWINNVRYAIDGKPPDSIRDAMKNMNNMEQQKVKELMMQSLLADRFQLKAHFETREMPVYELVPAKSGSKLQPVDDPKQIRFGMNPGLFQGTAPINSLIDFLQCSSEIGGRRVVDKTGLTGVYHIAVKWSPTQAASTAANGPGATPPPTDAEPTSLFTAIEEQLGLKLVPTKGPGQVLVIDHIEQPSPN